MGSTSPSSDVLAAIGNYGGPTQTVPPLSGSPALGAGGAITQTNAAITSATTSIPVANALVFAAATLPTLSSGFYYTIQIDAEQVQVIGVTVNSNGTGTLTVVRTANSTAAATHASNASVFLVSDQRGDLVPANTPPVVSMGAYQSTATNLLAPVVTAVTPDTGTTGGGTTVTVTGTNFTGVTTVDFGGTATSSFTVNSATQITAVASPGTGVVDVTITTSVGGTSATSSADQFSYFSAPTVAGLGPNTGPEAGGTSVIITGTGFIGATAVQFDGTAATSFTISSSTQISATVPAGTGVVDVTVTTPLGGTSATSSADQFTYVAAPTVTGLSPNSGPAAGGTSVIITGMGFIGATAVQFGGTAATSFTVDSATQITATAPAGTGVVDMTVTITGGATSATSSADQFTYVAVPTVTGLNPNSGPVAGGTSVIIAGTGFIGATEVQFGGTAATSFTINSSTQITATAPAGTGVVDVTVTIPGGATSATSSADQFTYVAAPTVTSVSPNFGSTSGGTSVTITGTNLTGATAVQFGSNAATTYTVNSATQITATAPAGSAGLVSVTVTTAVATSATSSSDDYVYVVSAQSSNFMVTDLSDTAGSASDVTLRYAITNSTNGSAITFTNGLTGTIDLNSPLVINNTISITGLGAGDTTIDGGGTGTFEVGPGAQPSIANMTVQNGSISLPSTLGPAAINLAGGVTVSSNINLGPLGDLIDSGSGSDTVSGVISGATSSGLVGAYYQGTNGNTQQSLIQPASSTNSNWIGNQTPNATALLTGAIDFPNISANGFQDNNGTLYHNFGNNNNDVEARWYGDITIPGAGTTPVPISFRTGSDDGSMLYIDGNAVVSNNNYQGFTYATDTVNLTPGLHTIDIEYYNGGGDAAMVAQWDPAGGSSFVNIPNSAFSVHANAVVKTGTGTLTLSNTNTYVGPTTINAGTLVATANGAMGPASGPGVTVNAAGALAFAGNVNYTNTEPINIIGSGPAGNGAIENISGNNTFAAPITLAGNATIGSDAGTLNLTSSTLNNMAASNLATAGAGNLIIASSLTDISDTAYVGFTAGAGALIRCRTFSIGPTPAASQTSITAPASAVVV